MSINGTMASVPIPYLVHRKLEFYKNSNFFYLVPIDQNGMHEVLVINRITAECRIIPEKEFLDDMQRSFLSSDIVYGVFGMIKLITGFHLILITEASLCGQISYPGGVVYRVEDVKIIPLLSPDKMVARFTEQQLEFNRRYLMVLESALHMPNYYFSYVHNLSSSLQRTAQRYMRKQTDHTLIEASNPEFVWNFYLLSHLIGQKCYYFCLPVICGFVNVHQNVINGHPFRWCLISRRSSFRAGTRFFARGIDSDGRVANYIETEQVLFTENGDAFSFVQVRGSIPLHWTQYPNLRYKPPVIIQESSKHLPSYRKHVQRLADQYGRLCFLNLISDKGSESRLLKAFADLVTEGNFNHGKEIPFVNFEWFDFHRQCKRLDWPIAIERLLNQVKTYIGEYSYLHLAKGHPANMRLAQHGIIRTNCVDSLDRTNVAQGIIAKQVLNQQMIQSGMIAGHEVLADYPEFHSVFCNVWADHADVCSTQYAGTKALKSDFTRTGKRRPAGAIADGVNSMVRYYKNNFEDGFRQDSLDLIQGSYRVDDREGNKIRCPLENRNVWKIFFLPFLFALSTIMALAILVLLLWHYPDIGLEQSFYALFWHAMSAICLVIMYTLGEEFADYPTLVPRR